MSPASPHYKAELTPCPPFHNSDPTQLRHTNTSPPYINPGTHPRVYIGGLGIMALSIRQHTLLEGDWGPDLLSMLGGRGLKGLGERGLKDGPTGAYKWTCGQHPRLNVAN